VENEPKGNTPISIFGAGTNETVSVRLEKFGYRPIRDRVTITTSSAAAERQYRFSNSSGLFGLFVTYSSHNSSRIAGWPSDSITTSGVRSDPILEISSRTGVDGFVQHSISRIMPFLTFSFPFTKSTAPRLCGNCDSSAYEFQSGVRFRLGALRRVGEVDVGGGAMWEPAAFNSSAPTVESRGKQLSLPYEYWDHPTPNVLLENSKRLHALGDIQIRPRGTMVFRAVVTNLLDATLHGTALIQDSVGHSVKDDTRSYTYSSSYGRGFEVAFYSTLHAIIPKCNLGCNLGRIALTVRYRTTKTIFPIFTERSSSVTVGIGILGFSSW